MILCELGRQARSLTRKKEQHPQNMGDIITALALFKTKKIRKNKIKDDKDEGLYWDIIFTPVEFTTMKVKNFNSTEWIMCKDVTPGGRDAVGYAFPKYRA